MTTRETTAGAPGEGPTSGDELAPDRGGASREPGGFPEPSGDSSGPLTAPTPPRRPRGPSKARGIHRRLTEREALEAARTDNTYEALVDEVAADRAHRIELDGNVEDLEALVEENRRILHGSGGRSGKSVAPAAASADGAVASVDSSGRVAPRFGPLGDRVLLRRLEASLKSSGGLWIPDTAAERINQGEVIGVGPEVADERLVEGARVVFGKYAGDEIVLADELFVVVREPDLLGVVMVRS